MKYGIIDFLTLVGALGFFLYGMKVMSESLQKVAGDKMRSILAKMTSNPVKGVLTGVLITAIIQSSSATTVMVVSFVNAGLLSLIESIGVIMGANIGTTVTAWLISLLGLKVNISVLSLPLIGIGFPLLFSKKNKRKYWGEFIIGFAMLFLGLDFLKNSVPDINSYPEILSFLADYTSNGVWSYLLFLGIGTILTMIIQSSSATMALTLVMCNNGWISYDIAAAMVLGENIGTTITANLAASIANVSAKRAARAHLMFNVLGVFWVSFFLPYFLRLIALFMTNSGANSPFEDPHSIPVALSIFHSSFNIINTLIFIWFTKLIAMLVTKMVPQKEDSEDFRLQHIQVGLLSTPELSIYQAKKEIIIYAQRVEKTFTMVEEMFNETNEKKFYKLYDKIEKYEGISDRMEVEIANYLTKISEGELSALGSKRIKAQLTIVSELESIADCCYNLAKTMIRKKDSKISLSPSLSDNIRKMMKLVHESIIEMQKNIELGYTKINIVHANELEQSINNYRDRLKKEHLKDIEKKEYDYKTGVIYADLFSECEKCADYVINVSEAVDGINKE